MTCRQKAFLIFILHFLVIAEIQLFLLLWSQLAPQPQQAALSCTSCPEPVGYLCPTPQQTQETLLLQVAPGASALLSTAIIAHAHNPARKNNVVTIARNYLSHWWIAEVVIVAQGPHALQGLERLYEEPRVRFHVVSSHPHINARWNVTGIKTPSFIMNDDDKMLDFDILQIIADEWLKNPTAIVATAPYRCVGDGKYNLAPCSGGNMVLPSVSMYPTPLISVYNDPKYFDAREIVRLQKGHCDDILASFLHNIAFNPAAKIIFNCNGPCVTDLADSENGISGRVFGLVLMEERTNCAGMIVRSLGIEAGLSTQAFLVEHELVKGAHRTPRTYPLLTAAADAE